MMIQRRRMHEAQHVSYVVAGGFLVWTLLVSVALAFTSTDYASALDKSILFFDVQRSGKLPSWQRVNWRANSALTDGKTSNVDLTGGYYDAGDNVKFGFPMAFSITLLSWSVVEFSPNLQKMGQLGNTLNAIRWGTDYLLKAHTGPTELWVQVGNPYSDHNCWERPEDMDTPRTAYKVSASSPGSDVAAETAAALASASMAFKTTDSSYSNKLLAAAKQAFDQENHGFRIPEDFFGPLYYACTQIEMLFSFADKYRGKYSDAISGAVCPFYCSYSGYNDELVWGASWMYKATNDNTYFQYLVSNGATLGGTTTSTNAFSWDNKYAGAQVLLAKFLLMGKTALQGYKDQADNFICNILPKSISPTSQTPVTPGGLLFHDSTVNMQYVTTASLLLTIYSKYLSSTKATVNCGGTHVTPAQMSAFAKQQADYILGHNPKSLSYMVGFGSSSPKHTHHRASSVPSLKAHPQKISCGDGYSTYFNSGNPNPNQATGAIVGGPDQNDNFNDVRSNYQQMEPTTYINAPMVGVFAALATGSAAE